MECAAHMQISPSSPYFITNHTNGKTFDSESCVFFSRCIPTKKKGAGIETMQTSTVSVLFFFTRLFTSRPIDPLPTVYFCNTSIGIFIDISAIRTDDTNKARGESFLKKKFKKTKQTVH